MIGLLEQNLLFEFRDEAGLAKALEYYTDQRDCNTLFICNKSDCIVAILFKDRFISTPKLVDDTSYIIYGCMSRQDELPSVGDFLSSVPYKDWNILGASFIFSAQFRVPKPFDNLF